MRCQICDDREAVVHVKQIADGELTEIHVCQECAHEHGVGEASPIGLTDFLFGLGKDKAAGAAASSDAITCDNCHMQAKDFRKSGRLGCASCYETFAVDLKVSMKGMHSGDVHKGKMPPNAVHDARTKHLQAALQEAIEAQDFEEAAKLRDEINSFEKEVCR